MKRKFTTKKSPTEAGLKIFLYGIYYNMIKENEIPKVSFIYTITPPTASIFAPVTEDKQFGIFSSFNTPKNAKINASLYSMSSLLAWTSLALVC